MKDISKEKLSDALIKAIFESNLKKSINQLNKSITEIDSSFAMTSAQENEIIAFELSAFLHGIGIAFKDRIDSEDFATVFTEKALKSLFEGNEPPQDFKQLMNERLQTYMELPLTHRDNAQFHLGHQLIQLMIDDEPVSKYLQIIMIAGGGWFVVALHIAKYFDLIFKEYSLK